MATSKQPRPTLAELLADHAGNQAAMQRGGRAAILACARAGLAVPVARDGKVVWIPPAEILARFADTPADDQPQ